MCIWKIKNREGLKMDEHSALALLIYCNNKCNSFKITHLKSQQANQTFKDIWECNNWTLDPHPSEWEFRLLWVGTQLFDGWHQNHMRESELITTVKLILFSTFLLSSNNIRIVEANTGLYGPERHTSTVLQFPWNKKCVNIGKCHLTL